MITKGIITSIDFTGNTCTVRMPFFETANNDPITGTATVSNTPGSYNGYKVGDVVWVAFENGQMDTPVILGKLYLGVEAEKGDPRGVLNVENSTITGTATMPADTKLKISTDSQVPNTLNPYSSISSIANGLNTLNTQIRELDKDFGHKIETIVERVDASEGTFSSMISESADEITNMVSHEYLPKESNGPAPSTSDNKKRGLGWELTETDWKIIAHDTVDENDDGIEETEKHFDIFTVNRKGITVNGDLKINGYPTDTVIEYAAFPKKNQFNATIDTQEEAKQYEVFAELSGNPIIWSTTMPDYDANKYIWQRVATKGYVWNEPTGSGDPGHWSANPETTKTTYTCLSNVEAAAEAVVNEAKIEINTTIDTEVTTVKQLALDLNQGKSTNYYGDALSDEQLEAVKRGDGWFNTGYKALKTVEVTGGGINLTDTEDFKKQALKGGYVEVNGQYKKMLELTTEDKAALNTLGSAAVFSHGSLLQCTDHDENGEPIWEDVNGTMITEKLTASYVNALDITAKSITVLNDTQGGLTPQQTIFMADGDTHEVEMAGFKVNYDAIYRPVTIDNITYRLGKDNTLFFGNATYEPAEIAGSEYVNGWQLAIGKNFGVRIANGQSELYADRGKIAGFELGDASYYTDGNLTYGGKYLRSGGQPGQDGSVLMSPGYQATISTLDTNTKKWAFTAGKNFGVTTGGDIFASTGKIAGFTIGNDKAESNSVWTSGGPYLKAGGSIGENGSILVSPGYKAQIQNLTNLNLNWAFLAGDKFGVATSGAVYAKKLTAVGADISGNIKADSFFGKDFYISYAENGTAMGVNNSLQISTSKESEEVNITFTASYEGSRDSNSGGTSFIEAPSDGEVGILTMANNLPDASISNKVTVRVTASEKLPATVTAAVPVEYTEYNESTGNYDSKTKTVKVLLLSGSTGSSKTVKLSDNSLAPCEVATNTNADISSVTSNSEKFVSYDPATLTAVMWRSMPKFTFGGDLIPATEAYTIEDDSGAIQTLYRSQYEIGSEDTYWNSAYVRNMRTEWLLPKDAYGGIGTTNVPWQNAYISKLHISSCLYPSNTSASIGTTANIWQNAYINKINGMTMGSASDKRLKTDIKYDLSDFDSFFDSIKPATFKWKDPVDNEKIHLGFIAQDIESIADKTSISVDKLGILELPQDKYSNYALLYNEFHALEIYEIQKLKKEIQLLKQELAAVKK